MFGEVVPKSLVMRISTQGALKNLIQSHGGGSLVQDGTSSSTLKVGQLELGALIPLLAGNRRLLSAPQNVDASSG